MAEVEEDERPLEPALDPANAWVWRAWNYLSDERPSEISGVAGPMGGVIWKSKPGRIPWRAVMTWCDVHEHRIEQRDTLYRLIRILDDEYLRWRKQKDSQ
ncbi:phage tail assembly chaperone [Roseomonas elaeocarpi]